MLVESVSLLFPFCHINKGYYSVLEGGPCLN